MPGRRPRVALPMAALTALLAWGVTAPASADGLRLGGVRVQAPADATQVVTVDHTRGHRARVALWTYADGRWRRAMGARGRTGYGGLVVGRRRRQGSGTTPLGTYALLSSFGTHAPQPGWDLPYRTVRPGDYWVEDNASAYYNRYRNRAQGGFAPGRSERLLHYRRQYEYAVVIGFNYAQPVRHRGAGIFLHVNGAGATAGCVSAPRWFLRRALARLDPAAHPVIAIGR